MLVVKLLQEFFIFCLMVLATVVFLHYPFKMANAQVKRWKTAKKDDDRSLSGKSPRNELTLKTI